MATDSDPLSTEQALARRQVVSLRCLHVAERIDLRRFEVGERVADGPLVIRAGEDGFAVLFRYGVVVFVDVSPIEQASFLSLLEDFLLKAHESPQAENLVVAVQAEGDERFSPDGVLTLHSLTVGRIQVLADILAKSVLLAHHEIRVSEAFDRIEPLASDLERGGRSRRKTSDLLRHIGSTLLIQHRVVGRAAVHEKPEILWEQPQLERLYQRLSEEYELSERYSALELKLDVINRTAETVLDMIRTRQSHRLEWYIILLIVAEIALTVYQLFLA